MAYDMNSFYDEDPEKLARDLNNIDPYKLLAALKAPSQPGLKKTGPQTEGQLGQGLQQKTAPAVSSGVEAGDLGSGLGVQAPPPSQVQLAPSTASPGMDPRMFGAGMAMMAQQQPKALTPTAPAGGGGRFGIAGPGKPNIQMPGPAGHDLKELYLRALLKRQIYGV